MSCIQNSVLQRTALGLIDSSANTNSAIHICYHIYIVCITEHALRVSDVSRGQGPRNLYVGL